MAHVPTKFQVAIYDAVKRLATEWPNFVGPNIGVNAVAGSGKSTTAHAACNHIPLMARGGYMAFNTKIVKDMIARGMPINVQTMTFNSFGWRICLANARPRLEEGKTNMIASGYYGEENKDLYYKTRGFMKRMVSLCRAHYIANPTRQDLEELTDKYSIDWPEKVPADIVAVNFIDIYQQCIGTTNLMDFDDQLFMPIHNHWTIPQYDFLFVDECQDLNIIQTMLTQLATKNGRVIAVGDPYQAIYGFRGADPDAFPNLMKALDAKQLPLSVCFRCPKKIVELAATIVPQIEAAPNAAEGIVATITEEEYRAKVQDGDFVICRCTAPLVQECLGMIRKKRKAMVEGRDLGKALMDAVESIDRMAGSSLIRKLESYRMTQSDKYAKLEQEHRVAEVNDRCDTVLALIEAALDDRKVHVKDPSQDEITAAAVIAKIDEIFSDFLKGIVYCTVHRVKGRETDRVFIIKPKLMPHPAAKKPWQKKQEDNLRYVAYTRAMKELYIVQEPKDGGK